MLVEAISGGSTVLSQTATDTTSVFISGTGVGYTTYSYSFVATGTTTTLSLTDTSTNIQQTDMYLDNVQVRSQTVRVAENSSNGTAVGMAIGLDPDGVLGLTYTLLDSAGGRFAINSTTGAITVADGSLLNFESSSSHVVTVRATDSGSLSVQRDVTIQLANVNEGPIATADTATAVEGWYRQRNRR